MKQMKSIAMILAGLFLMSLTANTQTFKADDVLGVWLNEDKDARVEVVKTGEMYFGKIIWLDEPNEPDTGEPKLDDENKDESLQSRPVMGLQLLKDFVFDGENRWEDGTIYDPKNGSTYKCRITMEQRNLLYIRGYIGRAWMGLGRTTEWTRVEE